jgi:hypothetical protein
VHPLKLEGTPYKGRRRRPSAFTEFSDFLCPFCKNIAGAFQSYLPGTAGRVSVYFKNYRARAGVQPERSRARSIRCRATLARGRLCANEQGRFWPFHDKVFFGTPLTNPSKADVVRLAWRGGARRRRVRNLPGRTAHQGEAGGGDRRRANRAASTRRRRCS